MAGSSFVRDCLSVDETRLTPRSPYPQAPRPVPGHLNEQLREQEARLFGFSLIRYTGLDFCYQSRLQECVSMSELKERRWAVLSERGCEEAGLSYEEATGLIKRLRGASIHGLCVITDEAASRLTPLKKTTKKSSPGGGDRPKPRRSRNKSAA
jgi:hypothetical protein